MPYPKCEWCGKDIPDFEGLPEDYVDTSIFLCDDCQGKFQAIALKIYKMCEHSEEQFTDMFTGIFFPE